MGNFPDVDIDFADRDRALLGLWHIQATLVDKSNGRQPHLTGVYFQNVPVNPLDNLCVYSHKEASEYGYFKFDFLNLNIYKDIRNEEHLQQLLNREVLWELLEDKEIVQSLNQIKDHYDIVNFIKPKNIIDLAVCIALIRPSKQHLIGRSRSDIDRLIWMPEQKYYYKKSHAIAYATGIVVQLNRLVEEAENVRS